MRSSRLESFKVLRRAERGIGSAASVKDIEKLRRFAQNSAAQSAAARNNLDASISNSIVDSLDEFLDTVDVSDFTKGASVGSELKVARDLWGRAKRAELMDDAIEVARDQPTGFENGIRIQLEKIVKNKRQKRFFKPEEIQAMRSVIQGTKGSNFFKKLGKLSFGRGRQSGFLGGSVGVSGGAIAGSKFGKIGALVGSVLFPGVGFLSQGLAERLTKNGAAFANQLVRAGKNGDRLTEVYLKNTPKSQQNPHDLSRILMRPDVNLENIPPSSLIDEALNLARNDRASNVARSAGTAQAIPQGQDENTPE